MKKNILALFALVSVLALMPSCTKIKEMFEPKYNIAAMVEDYPKYLEAGETEKAQKLLNKLAELNKNGQPLTDDQYFALEQYLTEDQLALFEEDEPYASEPSYNMEYEEGDFDEEEYDFDEEE